MLLLSCLKWNKLSASHLRQFAIERFHSRDQRPYLLNETKESFCITKEFNSHGTDLAHQNGGLFITGTPIWPT